MKDTMKILALFAGIAAIGTSCSKDDDDDGGNSDIKEWENSHVAIKNDNFHVVYPRDSFEAYDCDTLPPMSTPSPFHYATIVTRMASDTLYSISYCKSVETFETEEIYKKALAEEEEIMSAPGNFGFEPEKDENARVHDLSAIAMSWPTMQRPEGAEAPIFFKSTYYYLWNEKDGCIYRVIVQGPIDSEDDEHNFSNKSFVLMKNDILNTFYFK